LDSAKSRANTSRKDAGVISETENVPPQVTESSDEI
jgi:hypothetical protein